MIYLDNNATTRLDEEVAEVMHRYERDIYGNASSIHGAGRAARKAVDIARQQVAASLGAHPREIIFTGGGSEANNLAIGGLFAAKGGGVPGMNIVTTAVEHPSVLAAAQALGRLGAEVRVAPVLPSGALDLDALRALIDERTVLVSAMAVNNETGVIFPTAAIAEIAHERGVLYHCDAVQAFGKLPFTAVGWGADLLTVSGHKIHGPKGIGALYVRRGVLIEPVIHGGHQERGLRAGTENVAAIAGFGAAAERAESERAAHEPRIRALRDRLERELAAHIRGMKINGAEALRVAGTSNMSFQDTEGEAILLSLDLDGICASSGSACTAGSLEPSHVLLAMGLDKRLAGGSVRLSLSKCTTDAEIGRVIEVLPEHIERIRAIDVSYRPRA